MNFWEKIQEDIKKNLQEGIDIFREGSQAVTERIEKFTEEGRKKYKSFNLNMKVQEEFTKLGGEIYDLVSKKSKNPLGNRKVKSIISNINKLETRIGGLEEKEKKKAVKTTARKTERKSTRKTGKKTTAKKRTASKGVRKTTAKKRNTE